MNKKLTKKSKKNGFTMIEILVVIVIIGILSVIGLGSFRSSQIKARDSQRKSDLKSIGNALELYFNDNGRYPGGDSGEILGCGTNSQEVCLGGEMWDNDDGTVYMVQLPEDPSGGFYYYMSPYPGTNYKIYAHLENDQDRDAAKTISGDPTYYTEPHNENESACITGSCNYGRSSTNTDLGATN